MAVWLSTQYTLDEFERHMIAGAGIKLRTYLAGLFVSDLMQADLHALANYFMVGDFEINRVNGNGERAKKLYLVRARCHSKVAALSAAKTMTEYGQGNWEVIEV